MFTLEEFLRTNDGDKYISCKNHEESKECTAVLQSAGKKWKFGDEYSDYDVYERRPGVENVIYSNDGGWDHDAQGFLYVETYGGDIVQWSVLAAEVGLRGDIECVNSDEIEFLFTGLEVV